MKERFLQHCERTMIFYGDYSGAEFAREAMQRVIEGFEKMEDKSFPHNPFRFVRPFIIIIIIAITIVIMITEVVRQGAPPAEHPGGHGRGLVVRLRQHP